MAEQVNRRRGKINVNSKKTKKKFFQKKKFKLIVSIILFLLLIGLYVLNAQVLKPLKTARTESISVLLVGSDVNGYREEHYGGTKPEKTDSLIVATFNPTTYHADLTSIPRDTAVDYKCEETGEMRGKINEVYPASGNDIGCLVDTVSNFLNVPIDYYIKINMDQFVEIIDLVGPLKITAYADDGSFCQQNVNLTESYCFTDGEEYEMSGDEALTYSRFRKDSGKDYSRGIRQQQVMSQIIKQSLENGVNLELINTLFDMVDTNMEVGAMYAYYEHVDNVSRTFQMMNGDIDVSADVLPETTWKSIFEYYDYSQNKSVEEFFSESIESGEINLREYFITNHQFSDNYSSGGYFLAVDQTRYDISNALRSNLGLDTETPPAYEYSFGTNSFSESVVDDEGNSTIYYYEEPVSTNIDEDTNTQNDDTSDYYYYEEPVEPDTTVPDTTVPDTTEPDTTEPDTTDPDTTEPDTTDPDTTEPDTTDPDTTDPDTTDPDTTDPDTTDPGTTDPGTTEPGTTEPGTTEPDTI